MVKGLMRLKIQRLEDEVSLDACQNCLFQGSLTLQVACPHGVQEHQASERERESTAS